MPIRVKRELCSGCESCLDVCPYDAIDINDEKAEINEYCQMCMACLPVCPEGAIVEVKGTSAWAEDSGAGHKGVWVFAEVRDGKAAGVGFELLGAGRRLADDLGVPLSAVLLGAPRQEAEELIRYGAETVYFSNDEIFSAFNDEPYSQALTALVKEHKPEIVLAGATPIGRSFLPRVAARLETGLTADCTSLEIDRETRNLLQVRPAYGGNIMATILCPNRRPQMATVRPRVMKRGPYDESREGKIVEMDASGFKSRTKVLETTKDEGAGGAGGANLQEAEIIVAGGRGIGENGFSKLQELADLLGGSVGASRAAVDEGWIAYSHQVGQTGKTVCPKIYIACGISGAVQHLVGMQSSDIIIAINSNPEAPIHDAASYSITGDAREIVPLLIKKLKERSEG